MKLIELLNESAATDAFRGAVRAFLSSGHANDRVAFSPGSPPVKIERTLAKVVESYVELPIESVRIAGRSGCESFAGELVIRTADDERTIDFHWDCRWKAIQLGWLDYFGFPDQARAAREFGHECFRLWEEQSSLLSY